MSDDDTKPQDPPEPDGRDERVAALLEVPPLDEVTRRRLVRTAVAATSGPRSRLGLAIPVAAALVIGLVVGAVVVTRPDDETTTAARPKVSTSLEAPAQRAGEPETFDEGGGPVSAPGATPFVLLGDLGDVGTEDRLRAAARSAPDRALDGGGAGESNTAPPACTSTSPDQLGLVVVASAGTGTVGSNPVTVIIGTDPSGAEVAIALRASDCVEVLRTGLTGG